MTGFFLRYIIHHILFLSCINQICLAFRNQDLLFLSVLLLESCDALGYNITKGVMV